jgi:hypothetical protein
MQWLLLMLFVVLSCSPSAWSECFVGNLHIGSHRDVVLKDLTNQGCKLKSETPTGDLEDDLVIPQKQYPHAYYEVIFNRGNLSAVWSYSPVYTSAADAFSMFYDELVTHSSPAKPGKLADALGQRSISGSSVFLLRPLTGESRTIGVELDDGTVFMKTEKNNDGTLGIVVQTVRNR